MTFEVQLKQKKFFFDRKLVEFFIGKKVAAVFSKAGSFIRRRARSSMRRRKKSSAPGTPPSAHSSDAVATLKNILFAFDSRNTSVIVGPVKLNQVNELTSGSRVTVPHLHEFGGSVSIIEVSSDRGKTWRRWDRRSSPRPWEQFRRRQARYPKRPFMGPAVRAEMPKFPSLWAARAGAA